MQARLENERKPKKHHLACSAFYTYLHYVEFYQTSSKYTIHQVLLFACIGLHLKVLKYWLKSTYFNYSETHQM